MMNLDSLFFGGGIVVFIFAVWLLIMTLLIPVWLYECLQCLRRMESFSKKQEDALSRHRSFIRQTVDKASADVEAARIALENIQALEVAASDANIEE